MVLTNGSGYSIAGSTGTSTGTGTTQWCYGSDSQTATGNIKIYLNDVLKYTSTGTYTDTLYPICAQNKNGAQITLTTNAGQIIEWTLPTNFFITLPPSASLGADQDTGASHYYDQFVAIGTGGNPTPFIEYIRVGAETPTGNMGNIVAGDVIKITLGDIPTSGTRLPPPPLVAYF